MASNASIGAGAVQGDRSEDLDHHQHLPPAIREQIADCALKLPSGQILGKLRQYQALAAVALANRRRFEDPIAQVMAAVASANRRRAEDPVAQVMAWIAGFEAERLRETAQLPSVASVLRSGGRRYRTHRHVMGEPTAAQLRRWARLDKRRA